MKSFIKSIKKGIILVLPLFALLFSEPTYANLPQSQLQMFSQNNILFYNPADCVSSGFLSSICGSTPKEKYWSALRRVFDETHAAAVMGSINHEGGFGPTRWEIGVLVSGDGGHFIRDWNTLYNCTPGHCPGGVGAFGITWTLGPYLQHVNSMDSSLLHYFQDPANYSFAGDTAMPKIGETDFDKIVEIEVNYVLNEANIEEFKKTTSLQEAADWWTIHYENCSNCCGGADKDHSCESVQPRRNSAQKLYDEFKDFTCGGSTTSSSSTSTTSSSSSSKASSTDITLIGDSISVQSEAELQAKFPSSFLNKVGSRHSTSGGSCSGDGGGLDVLEKLVAGSGTIMDQHSSGACESTQVESSLLKNNVVWELGTNSNGATKETINKVINQISNRNLYLVTPYDGNRVASSDSIAAMYREVAAEHNNVYIVDWNKAVRDNESTYITRSDSMAVHPTAAGRKLLADLIAEALTNSGGCDGVNPIVTVNGNEYMYPLAGAAKDNYLQPGDKNGESVLSPLPWTNYSPGSCHHDYVALDMGLNKSKVDGSVKKPSDYPDLSSYSDMYYYSTGVKALAFVEGEITNYSCYKNKVPDGYDSACKCASIDFKGVDGNTYWIGHLSYDSNIKAGQKFKLGDVIGEVGPPPCAQGTQAHIHINIEPSSANNTKLYDIINATYEALPETSGGTSSAGCASTCKNSNVKIEGGLTEEQAQKLADYYNSSKVDASEWGLPSGKKNCVSFTAFFAQRFTSHGKWSGAWGNGKDTAHGIATRTNAPEGTEPQPYSAFSVTRGVTECDKIRHIKCGHTGIVVGVNGDDILVVEAGYNKDPSKSFGAIVTHYKPDYFINAEHGDTFTYLSSILNMSDLQSVIGK